MAFRSTYNLIAADDANLFHETDMSALPSFLWNPFVYINFIAFPNSAQLNLQDPPIVMINYMGATKDRPEGSVLMSAFKDTSIIQLTVVLGSGSKDLDADKESFRDYVSSGTADPNSKQVAHYTIVDKLNRGYFHCELGGLVTSNTLLSQVLNGIAIDPNAMLSEISGLELNVIEGPATLSPSVSPTWEDIANSPIRGKHNLTPRSALQTQVTIQYPDQAKLKDSYTGKVPIPICLISSATYRPVPNTSIFNFDTENIVVKMYAE